MSYSAPTESVMLRVAGIQMTSGGSVDDCLEQAERGLASAAEQGAQLVVLPEMFATLGTGASARVAADEANGDGPIAEWLMSRAAAHGIAIQGGTVPVLQEESGKSRARSWLIGPDGEPLGWYDKIHLFDASIGDSQGRYRESDYYEAGDRIVVVSLPGLDGKPVKVGLTVCYDLRFPELYWALRRANADLILVPSAFTHRTGEKHWQLLLRARAVEQGVYVFGVNQCGWHDSKRQTWGHSQLIDPWGEIVAELGHTPDVLVSELDRNRLEQVRARMPVHEHHRLHPPDLDL